LANLCDLLIYFIFRSDARNQTYILCIKNSVKNNVLFEYMQINDLQRNDQWIFLPR